jgi:uncharacterized protein (TIGR02466 family)
VKLDHFFPTSVGSRQDLEFTNKILEISTPILDKISKKHPNLNYISTFGDNKISKQLRSINWLNDYILTLGYSYLKELGFTPWWSLEMDSFVSRMDKDDNHGLHTHPNSILSGVAYLRFEPEENNNSESSNHLIFEDPRVERKFNYLQQSNPPLHTNSSEVYFTPKVGDIIIWESFIPHMVKNNTLDVRETFVFNLVLSNQK